MKLWQILLVAFLTLFFLTGCTNLTAKVQATDGFQEANVPLGIGFWWRCDNVFMIGPPPGGYLKERSNFSAEAAGDAIKEEPDAIPE